MTKDDFLIEEEQVLYQGFLSIRRYILKHKLFAGGWSPSFDREVVLRAHAVGVLPYDPVLDKVILIQQFRIGALEDPVSPWLHEIVAGLLEEGEQPEDVAIREIQEEAGVAAQELIELYRYWVSPGAANEHLTLFCARVDSTQAGQFCGLVEDENEDILVNVVDSAKAFQMIKDGEIRNCTSIVALQWLELHQKELRQKWLKASP